MKDPQIRPAAIRIVAAIVVVLSSFLVVSCFSLGGMAEESAAQDEYLYAESSLDAGAPSPAPAAAERSAAVSQAATGASVPLLTDSKQTTGATDAEPDTPGRRMRVYSADLEVVVASVAASRDRIIGMVEAGGGYVESSAADYLVVRVPAERFDSTLDDIEREGDVRSRAVRTADVTEQFLDLERRLQISEASRDRLLNLLEQAEDPDERVAILRDIRRLSEEIEQLRSSLESLEQLIRFSRITIRLISRIQLSQISRREIPFWWIASLDPLSSVAGAASSDIPVTPDESFAVFETGRRLFAEAADGTQLRGGAVENEPSGDEQFWQDALAFNLGPFYREVTEIVAGEYRGVLLQSKDGEPFYYLVAVHARDDELVVMEAFFPTTAAKDMRLAKIRGAMAGGSQ